MILVLAEPLYSMESADGLRLYYQAETLEAILLAAACFHEDFPGEEFVVMRAGEYDASATFLCQDGFAA